MNEYHKIQSVFKRDEKTKKFILNDWSTLELEYLKSNIWVWDEKIDGTNIRVGWDKNEVFFSGRTDRATIPNHLLARLNEIFTPDKLKKSFPDTVVPVTLYGEGFGHKIQKGGLYLGDRCDFILFDIKVGNWWLKRDAIEKIAEELEIRIVPIIGEGTILEAIEYVKPGFKSRFGTADAEGLVLRPKVHLTSRSGIRIITKVKTRDFR